MYIGFVYDRKGLGFSCIKDGRAAKQVSNLVKFLKKTEGVSEVSVVKRGKQTWIGVYAKKVLIAVFIFFKSNHVEPNIEPPSFTISEVHQYWNSKSYNFRSSAFPSTISNFLLKFRGGSNESTTEEEKKLIRSILAKTRNSPYRETSPNKILKKILRFIDPVISDQRFWIIVNTCIKSTKSELSLDTRDASLDTRDAFEPAKAEAFLITPKTLSPMQRKVQLKMDANEDRSSIEKKTRLRRAKPLYPSEVLGDSYQYGGKQLERKGPRHLEDFGISTEGKTVEELGMEYKDFVESLLLRSDLVIHKDGTLNKQEPTINFGDPESFGIVAFENNPLDENHSFITSYPISKKAFDNFKETGNIGSSPEEKVQKKFEQQQARAEAEREKTLVRSFYLSLPEDARIGRNQIPVVKSIQRRLNENPNSTLTRKEETLMQRAEKHRRYKEKFCETHPDIDRNKFYNV